MKITVLAGGGLTSWFACGHLLQKGYDIEVLVFNVGDADAILREHFITVLRAHGVNVVVQDRKAEIAVIGLQLARGRGRYPNGYWNTTSISRACFAFEALKYLQEIDRPVIAHGCVAFGNDQRRMDRLLGALNPNVKVYAVTGEILAAGESLSRSEMIESIGTWFGFRNEELNKKRQWSIEGSILGMAHEGAPIENVSDDWRVAPFLMTRDPFKDEFAENVLVEIQSGRAVRINDVSGDDLSILTAANAIAGSHGVGRIGVMEDKISGNKCRGVYEAPGVTLLGECFHRLHEAVLPADQLHRLSKHSARYADDIYNGEYYSQAAIENRQIIDDMTGAISGSLNLTVRGGYMQIERIDTHCDPGSIERRFHLGGAAWSNVRLVPV